MKTEFKHNIKFIEPLDEEAQIALKKHYLESLLEAPDGMWESFRNNGQNIGFCIEDQIVGYGTLNENNQLINFYVLKRLQNRAVEILRKFIARKRITQGFVSTVNPIYLSTALKALKKKKTHTFLFRELNDTDLQTRNEAVKVAYKEDIDDLVGFYSQSIGAPRDWLLEYTKGLIKKKALFYIGNKDSIIGVFEVRKNNQNSAFADIGMVVLPDFRRMGYGTFLLNEAKKMSIDLGLQPICSCEKSNSGSLKSIRKVGFVSNHEIIEAVF